MADALNEHVGEIVCSWTSEHGVRVLSAPLIAVATWDVIDSFQRGVGDELRIVFLPDGTRYRIGGAVPDRPGRIYLRRMP